ncbi:MAG: XRE family transcriptional regulator [Eubacteriaceae bacterium]|nr:XRE family transcriptional regulator [Eubacteriaceae bacterium]MDD4507460.1 XRE family transcriptional regulator [Eubacteriaceae bacterium]
MSTPINKKIFGQRLKQLMHNYNETTYSLSRQFKLSPPSISRYTRGEMAPKMTTIHALAEYFDVNPEWLIGKTVSMYESEILSDDTMDSNAFFDISVFDEIRYDRPIFSNHKNGKHISLPINQLTMWGPVFGYQVPDNAMDPVLKSGDLVAIQLNTTVHSGNFIALHVNEGTMIIRKITLKGTNIITQPYNPHFNANSYNLRKNNVQIIGSVVYCLHQEEHFFTFSSDNNEKTYVK